MTPVFILGLNSCGEQGQSFVTSEAGAVEFQVEPNSGDAQAALPDVTGDDAESILKPLDVLGSSSQSQSSPAQRSTIMPGKSETQSSGARPESDESSDSRESRACLALTGASASDLVEIRGNESTVTLKSSNVIIVRVTGNQNRVKLDLSRASGTIRAVCVFASGNQSQVTATIGLTVERVVFVARGNLCKGDFHVSGSGKIGSQIVDLSGNGSSFQIDGDGDYHSSSAIVRGNSSGFICSQK